MPKYDLFALYAGLFYRMHRLLDRQMAAEGASLAQAKVLLFVAKRGPARATDIAEMFGLAPRTVTETIDRLERDGLVVREQDAVDRRVKRVRLTPAGDQAIAVIEPIRNDLVARIFATLTEAECDQFHAIISKLGDVLGHEEDCEEAGR